METGLDNLTRREFFGFLAALGMPSLWARGNESQTAQSPGYTTSNPSIEEYYNTALQRFSRGDTEGSLDMLLQMDKKFPDSADALFIASNTRMIGLVSEEERIMNAINGYTKAIALNENFAEAMINWAIVSFIILGPSLEELKEMWDSFYKSEFKKPFGLDPDKTFPLIAINKVMDEVIALKPNLFSARFNKGIYLLYSGMPKEAAGEFSKAIEIGLKDADWSSYTPTFKDEKSTEVLMSLHPLYVISALVKCHATRNLTYKIDGESLVTLSNDFDGIYLQNPNNSLALAYYHRGISYAHLGDYAKTIADCSESVRLNPRVRSYVTLLTAQRITGKQSESEATIRQLNDFSERMNRLLKKRFRFITK